MHVSASWRITHWTTASHTSVSTSSRITGPQLAIYTSPWLSSIDTSTSELTTFYLKTTLQLHRTVEHEGSLHPFIPPCLSLNEVSPFVFQQRRQTHTVTPVTPPHDKIIKLCLWAAVCSVSMAVALILPPQRPMHATVIFSAINIMPEPEPWRTGCRLGDKAGEEGCEHALLWATVCCASVGSGTLMGAS